MSLRFNCIGKKDIPYNTTLHRLPLLDFDKTYMRKHLKHWRELFSAKFSEPNIEEDGTELYKLYGDMDS